ncbi:MAG: efflux RND transporter periplasmic adaptor subunit [Pseudomonadota bacterium]|nr:efflux RND transporter periplasmic adaptor subunit [Pseudomonadota bacterium]
MRLSLLLLFPLVVHASPIKLTPIQVKSLGIQTASLTRHAGSLSTGMPATVVIPDGQTRVVAAPLAGLVLETRAAEGEPVRRGQVLARLSSPELIGLQGGLAQAASALDLARDSARRDEGLLREGIIPESRARASAATLAQTKAALNAQRAALRAQGLSDAAIARAERGEGFASEITLSAPISGVVMARQVTPGSRVEAATALYTIANLNPLWIEIDAPADVAARVKAGMKVELPGRQLKGVVLRVLPAAGAAQTVRLRARLDNVNTGPDATLRAGQSVAARIEGLGGGQEWRVPVKAVAREAGKSYVFVRRPDGFEARQITVLSQSANTVSLAGEFKDGELVAVGGIAALKSVWLGAEDAK